MRNFLTRSVPVPTIPRNAFDLSHEKKLSCQIGELVPFFWMECVPGDQVSIKSELLVKLMPMLAPVLHRMDVYTHYFKVPYRIIWEAEHGGDRCSFEDFITQDPDGLITPGCLVPPYVTINNANKAYFLESTLADYLGLPVIDSATTVTQEIDINVLPFFAYHVINDDYYRDENLIARHTSRVDSGVDITLFGGDQNADIDKICLTALYTRAYEKDLFKGALPTAYVGSASDVELDLDVIGSGLGSLNLYRTTGAAPTAGSIDVTAGGIVQDTSPANLRFRTGYSTSAEAVLEMTELRRAMAITRWLEAMRRGGIRYSEMQRGVWGVISDNSQLEEPEYIGGGKQAVQITSVLNQSQVLDPTAGVNDGGAGVPVTVDPQALETGRGLSVGSNYAKTYCKEHCIIMGILSVLPRTCYGGAQIERFWRKFDPEDFFAPQLQGLGDVAMLQSEVGYNAVGVDADNVFGYHPPWYEYKQKYSTVHSAFLSTLDYWHMAEIGDTSGAGPDLNAAYVNCSYAEDQNIRIFADQTNEDHIIVEIYNDVRAIRPMLKHDFPRL